MELDLYKRFWEKTPASKRDFKFNGKGERLGDYQPLIQNEMLEDLKHLAEEEGVEGWMDYVSPESTFRENMESLRTARKGISSSTSIRARRDQIGEGAEPYIAKTEHEAEKQEQRTERVRAERSDDGRYLREPEGHWGDDPDEVSFVVLDEDKDEDDW